jgi:hypothetical protein
VLVLYVGLCLALQAVLSQPAAALATTRATCGLRAPNGIYARTQLALLAVARRCFGSRHKYKILPIDEADRGE